MKDKYSALPRNVIAILATAAALGLTLTGAAVAQATRPVTDSAERSRQSGIYAEREAKIGEHEIQMRNLELERARAAAARNPRAALAGVNEDFARLKAVNEEVAARRTDDYKALAEAMAEVRKRALRLKSSLLFPAPDKDEKRQQVLDGIDQGGLQPALSALNDLVISFTTNPVLKGNSGVDPQLASKARRDLEGIIELSEKIRKGAEKLHKAASGR